MNDKKAKKARALKAKGWSLRDIASEVGMSHEGVRGLLGPTPDHMKPPPKPRRPRSSKRASGATLLDLCRELLSELRRRARTTQHPTLGTRYSADATNLAGLVLRLETESATRAEGLSLSRAQIIEAHNTLHRFMLAQIEAARARGELFCTVCGTELDIQLKDEGPPVEVLAHAAAAPDAFSTDGMIAEARAAMKWLLDSTADAEAIGNEMATQRAGRAAVSIAGFVARLEKAISKTRSDVCNVPPSELAAADNMNETRIAALAEHGRYLCHQCSHDRSVVWGTGTGE